MSFVLPIYLLLQSNEPIDSHRWINKANYKLVACRHLHFAFQWTCVCASDDGGTGFGTHCLAYAMCCACFYLYLIIINCIQTSLLWDANKETQRATSSVSKCSDLCLALRQSWSQFPSCIRRRFVLSIGHANFNTVYCKCARESLDCFFFVAWKVVRWLSHMHVMHLCLAGWRATANGSLAF